MTAITAPATSPSTGLPLPARRSSPDATQGGGAGALLARQSRGELRKLLRAPDFVAPVVLLPVVLYALFAGPSLGNVTDDGFAIGPVLTASFLAYGVLGVILFTFGEAVASERGMGWLRLVRTTPLPGWAFIGAKLVAGTVLIAMVVALMIAASTAFGVRMDAATWARVGATVLLGGMAMAPIGFLVGFLVRPSAAGAVALLVYLPLSFASGMWTPIEFLPEPVQAIAPYLPTYHLTQLAHAAAGVPTDDIAIHVAWLVGTLIVGGTAAVWAYRRVAGRQFA